MKKNKISKSWLRKQYKDPFFKKSKIEGYRSRSAYKLIEINKKFNFLKKDTYLLDLGSSPGGWTQVARKKITKGKIMALDLKDMKKIDDVYFMKIDIANLEICNKIFNYFDKKIDVVVSDMAINTSGNKNIDSYRTGELCLTAMNLARKVLNLDGVFVGKVFMGSIFSEINEKANKYFKKVARYKPLSSKQESKELYIYCKGIIT